MTGTDRATPNAAPRAAATPRPAAAGGDLHDLPVDVYDGFARLAARLFDAPMAFVWWAGRPLPALKGQFNWPPEGRSWAAALGAMVCRGSDPVGHGDMGADPELARASFVGGPPHLRLFAGTPLRAGDGTVIGAICVAGPTARQTPSDAQLAALREMAELVAQQLDLVGQSRARLTDFIATGSDWLWETDSDHRFSHFIELHDIFPGGSPYDSIGKRRWELPGVDAADPRWVAHIADLDARRPFRNFEYSSQYPLGGERYLRVSGRAIFSDTGKFLGYRGTAADVTEQKWSAERLRASEARFRYLFEKNPNPMWVYENGSMRFLEVNDAAIALYGYSREEFLSMTIFDIRSPEEAARAAETIPTFPLTGFWHGGVWQHRDKSGRTIDVEVVSDDMLYEGRSAYIVAVRDVTEQLKIEAALRESEDRFRKIADSVPGIIWLTDVEGRITFLSKAFEEYTGKPGEAYYGMTSTHSSHPDDNVTVTPQYEAAAEARCRLTYEYRVRRHDGQFRRHLDTCVPRFDDSGRFLGYIGMLTDVEEMRQLSEQLHQAQKMQAVGQLTGGVAHDFNNLLTIILGNVELLSERLTEPQLRRLADATREAAERSASLVQRLLAFSRRQTLRPTVVDVNELIAGMQDLLARTVGGGIDIGYSFAREPWRAQVDRSQLEAAILNLAANARDAMPEGGRLTVETANIETAEPAPELELALEPHVMIAVSDTGCGMSQEVRRQAFEPFFTTKDVGKGSGLGLSMVYGFIKQTGGNVTLSSKVGTGTTVRIYLPRADAETGGTRS